MSVPQLQWELARSSDSTLSIARGIIRASTSDNVQTLTLLACERFGNTLAICPETCRKVELQVTKLQTPIKSVITFLNATVGYSAGDSSSQLAQSLAGIQFLGLAAVLIPSYSFFDAATALAAMLSNSALDKTLLPPARHLKDLLTSLEHRCVQMGFADLVLGWAQILSQQPETSSQKQRWRSGEYIPDTDGLKKLVDALRQLSRIGNASSLKIKATYCAPWVAAFIQWCIGVSPTVHMENGRPIIEQPLSRINLIAIVEVSDCPSLHITVQESIGSPIELISASDCRQSGSRMVGIERYGQWLLQDMGVDSGNIGRATLQALPYCLKQVVRFLSVAKLPEDDRSNRGVKKLFDQLMYEQDLFELVPSPFPKDAVVSAMLSRILGSSQIIKSLSLKDGLRIADLPLVEQYINDCKKRCDCSCCKYSEDSSNCEVDHESAFLRNISPIVADILALSLFDFPESLLVQLRGHHHDIATLENAVFTILEQDLSKPVICPIGEILQHGLALIGHDVEKDVMAREWVISSFRGQVVYPKIFESQYIEKTGFLMINWAPGLLEYDGEKYSRGMSETLSNLQDDTLNCQETKTVDIPRNLVPGQKVVWEVSPGDNVLRINMGLQDSINGMRHISKTPFKVLRNLSHSIFLETCSHPSNSPLMKPDTLLRYTGPLEPFWRQERQESLPCPISVVAVEGNDGLRLLALTWGYPVPFVIRRNACLACCIEICRRTGYQMIVC